MKIVIKETNKIEHLVIGNEIKELNDLIKDHSCCNNIDENGNMIMNQNEFNSWKNYIDNYKMDEQEIKELAKKLNIDECLIRNRINNNCNIDINNEHDIKQEVIKQYKNEFNKRRK